VAVRFVSAGRGLQSRLRAWLPESHSAVHF
jgi:hypothetical protein